MYMKEKGMCSSAFTVCTDMYSYLLFRVGGKMFAVDGNKKDMEFLKHTQKRILDKNIKVKYQNVEDGICCDVKEIEFVDEQVNV